LLDAVDHLAVECQHTGRTVIVAKVNCDNYDYQKPELLQVEEEDPNAFPDPLMEYIFRIMYVENQVLPTIQYYHGGDALMDDFLLLPPSEEGVTTTLY
jgi:hypothetical protein